ncbi:hypothetical protein N7G274_008669 [Stereocaulon virgatum]|uniref:BTB domain-containing protein n=1 Tax=Stereocaulon virgatum TaxID=373712 RepID=A0ABR4A018_9LECA
MEAKALSTSMQNEPQITSQTSVIDREGDLYMGLDHGALLVSRKALCLGSPVLLAMLGDDSQFSERIARKTGSDGVQIIRFQDDDFSAMQVVVNIMHLQNDKVPQNVSFQQLHQIAILCDKYDLKRCLGYWPEKWTAPWLESYSKTGHEAMLFISITFKLTSAFEDITAHLIRNTTVSSSGSLVTLSEVEIGEGVSSKIIDQIRARREKAIFAVRDLCWRELCALRNSNIKRVCNRSQSRAYDAANLGCLSQQFPNLCNPRNDTEYRSETLMDLVEATKKIYDFVDTIDLRRGHWSRDHFSCSVGPRLAIGAEKILGGVHGLKLD